MASLVGKTLGKVTFLAEEKPPEDEPRRRKYGPMWYRIRCECGIEKLIPKTGAYGYRSCGCEQYIRNRTMANETIRYTPNRTPGPSKEQVYADL